MALRAVLPSENRHEGEIAKSRVIVAVEACRGRSWNTYFFSHRESRKPHCVFEFTRPNLQKPKWHDNQTTNENRHKPNRGRWGASRGIKTFPQNSQNHISETKMVRQLRRHATARIYIFKIFVSSFFSSPTTCCLRLTMSAPLVWPGLSMVLMLKVSGSLALWTWLSVLALCCCCLSAFRSLCCSLDLPWFWIPGSPGWLELCCRWQVRAVIGWQGGGGDYSTCIL